MVPIVDQLSSSPDIMSSPGIWRGTELIKERQGFVWSEFNVDEIVNLATGKKQLKKKRISLKKMKKWHYINH